MSSVAWRGSDSSYDFREDEDEYSSTSIQQDLSLREDDFSKVSLENSLDVDAVKLENVGEDQDKPKPLDQPLKSMDEESKSYRTDWQGHRSSNMKKSENETKDRHDDHGSRRNVGVNINIAGLKNSIYFNNLKSVDQLGYQCDHVAPMDKQKLIVKKGILTDSAIFEVAKRVGPIWRALGDLLGFTLNDLDILELDFKMGGCQEMCYRMLVDWRERESGHATHIALGNALLKIRRCDVVKDHLVASKG